MFIECCYYWQQCECPIVSNSWIKDGVVGQLVEGVDEEWHEKNDTTKDNPICVNFCAGICIKRYSMLIYQNIKWQLSEDKVSGNF